MEKFEKILKDIKTEKEFIEKCVTDIDFFDKYIETCKYSSVILSCFQKIYKNKGVEILNTFKKYFPIEREDNTWSYDKFLSCTVFDFLIYGKYGEEQKNNELAISILNNKFYELDKNYLSILLNERINTLNSGGVPDYAKFMLKMSDTDENITYDQKRLNTAVSILKKFGLHN